MPTNRDRIARDLHLRVVARLDAIRLLVELAADDDLARDEAAELLQEATQTVDLTQADIREAVLEWRARDASVVTSLRGVVEDYSPLMRAIPQVEAVGPVDEVSSAVAVNLVPVLREALSNVARHAAAENVLIELRVTEDEVRLTVEDDGVGVPVSIVENGMRQVRRRAEALHGSFEVNQRQPRGTTFVWRVPLG